MQPSLFTQQQESTLLTPLADRLRPNTLDEMVGQESLLGAGMPLRVMAEQGRLVSLLFWGPPGVGKTTLAKVLAQAAGCPFEQLSATSSGLKDLRDVIQRAEDRRHRLGQQTLLFLDEIHRYSKTQQDALLPHVEQGTLILIGATTENPSFQVNNALLSRLLLLRLQPLESPHLEQLMDKALAALNHAFSFHPEARAYLLRYANGDARRLLTAIEGGAACFKPEQVVTAEELAQLLQEAVVAYDRQDDNHYDHASAFQKSLRGSDPDAAIYWLAKMIAGGEDLRFIARRLVVTAAEDVGLADPQALILARAAFEAAEQLGWPEARIPLSVATVYVAKAPKSNKAYLAVDKALADIRQGKAYPVPSHLRDAHYGDAKSYGHGVGYKYSHDHPDTPQQFLPDALRDTRYLEE